MVNRRHAGSGLIRRVGATLFAEDTPLDEAFLAEFDAGAVRALYIAQAGDYAAGVWTDRSGLGNNTAQATGTKQPAYSATAINSRPGLTFDGGDCLTVTLDLSAYTWCACMALFQDTNTGATIKAIVEHGASVGAGAGFLLAVNETTADTVEFYGRTNVGLNGARSAGTITMASPAVVTGYFDPTLATNEAEIRHDLANVTNNRPFNNNNTTTALGNLVLNIGARNDAASLGFTGALGFLAVIAGTGGVAGHVAEIAAGEVHPNDAWGL